MSDYRIWRLRLLIRRQSRLDILSDGEAVVLAISKGAFSVDTFYSNTFNLLMGKPLTTASRWVFSLTLIGSHRGTPAFIIPWKESRGRHSRLGSEQERIMGQGCRLLVIWIIALTAAEASLTSKYESTCETLPSEIHITKDDFDKSSGQSRTCEQTVAVNKCEGACVSSLQPSALNSHGFQKVCCSSERQKSRKTDPYFCFDCTLIWISRHFFKPIQKDFLKAELVRRSNPSFPWNRSVIAAGNRLTERGPSPWVTALTGTASDWPDLAARCKWPSTSPWTANVTLVATKTLLFHKQNQCQKSKRRQVQTDENIFHFQI